MKVAAIIVGRGTATFKIHLIIEARQPAVYAALAHVPFLPEDDELTPEQRELDKLMRQRPRGILRGEV